MCGIAGIHRLTDAPVSKLDVLAGNLLDCIEERGTHATGYAAITDDGRVAAQRASCKASDFNKHRRGLPSDARTVILHTRFATQGPASFPENNHPVRSGSIYVVHNGHIWNDKEIFWGATFKRRGEVDSEAIAAYLRLNNWTASIPKLGSDLNGDAAFAAINKEAPGELLLVRAANSPLYVLKSRKLIAWASTRAALAKAWKDTYGRGATLPAIDYKPEGWAMVARGSEVEEVRFTVFGRYKWTNGQTHTSIKDAAKIIDRAKRKATGGTWTRREGEAGGMIYSGMVPEDDDTLARIYDVGAEDAVKCDDCGDWRPALAMNVVKVMGGMNNLLCPECKAWAVDKGLTV